MGSDIAATRATIGFATQTATLAPLWLSLWLREDAIGQLNRAMDGGSRAEESPAEGACRGPRATILLE
jgi:hypothetical protein